MNELFLSPLGPALLLFLASIALRIFASPRRSSVLALLTLLPLALTTVLLIRLRSLPGALVASTTWWPVVVPAQEILWAMDGWNWLSLLLILLTGTTAILLTWFVPGKRSGAFHGLSMLLLATAAVTVVSDNLLALSGAWVATDIALIAVARSRQAPALDGEPRRRTAPIWYVAGGSLLVMMAIGITSLSIASTNLASASFPPETVILLLVAAALRMAAYPLHVWLAPDSVARDRGTQLLVNGIGLITGAWLLGRLVVLGAATWLADPVWIPLLTILVLVASIAAWLSRRADRFSMLASARATWLWLAVALAPIVLGRDALGWALTSTVLTLMLLAVAQAIQEQWGWRLPLALAAATLAGVPFTAGMPAYALASPTNLAVFLIGVVATALAVAVVLMSGRPTPNETSRETNPTPVSYRVNWPVVRLLIAMGLCLIPNLLAGLRPLAFARSAGFSFDQALSGYLGLWGFGGALATIAALALGWGFSRLLAFPNQTMAVWRPRIAQALGLAWLLDAVRLLLSGLETVVRNGLRVMEGEGYLGWVFVMILLAWLVIQI